MKCCDTVLCFIIVQHWVCSIKCLCYGSVEPGYFLKDEHLLEI